MPRKSSFKHHRFPREIILCAVGRYLRYPLSYQDVCDLLEGRGHIHHNAPSVRGEIAFIHGRFKPVAT